MFNEQLMDRHFPVGAMLLETICAIGVSPAPFIELGCRNATPRAAVKPADEMIRQERIPLAEFLERTRKETGEFQ